MTPTSSHRAPVSDDEPRSAVLAELSWVPRVTSSHIGVAVSDGAVTLSGEVGSSWSERRSAEQASWSAPGVTGVLHHLRTQY